MDLGVRGRRAIVCGASAGLGLGCAQALAAEGVHVTIAARGAEALRHAALSLRETTSVEVREVVCDVTTLDGRAALLAACPAPDIVVNNAAGPPPGDFRQWDEETWLAAVRANMLTPIELIRLTVDGMIARRWGRIVNITSSTTKAPIGPLGLSTGARAGLTGFVGGLARDVAPYGVTINNLLPGYFETRRLGKRLCSDGRGRREGLPRRFAPTSAPKFRRAASAAPRSSGRPAPSSVRRPQAI